MMKIIEESLFMVLWSLLLVSILQCEPEHKIQHQPFLLASDNHDTAEISNANSHIIIEKDHSLVGSHGFDQ